MTDLEERVRDALLARAGEFTTSPDAWERTTARAGRRAIRRQARRPARQRWLTRFAPLAAAATVLVVGVGTATLAETGGFSATLRHIGLGPSGARVPYIPPSSGDGGGVAPEPLCAFPDLSTRFHPVGVPISAKVTRDGVTTWWVRIPGSPHQALCRTPHGGFVNSVYGDGSSSAEAPLGAGQLVRADPITRGIGAGSFVSGIATESVTSVEADLANGNAVRGSVAYGAGFPYAAWWLTYPQGIAATLVFRDAAGRVVKEMSEPYPGAEALKHPAPLPAIRRDVPTGPTLCQQAQVQQVMDGMKVWTDVGLFEPSAVTSLQAAGPTLCEVTGLIGAEASYMGSYSMPAGQVARSLFVLYPTSSVSGIANPDVTSVMAVLADGRQYTGTFVRGDGFTYPVWLVSYPLKESATLVFRNAAGEQIAVLHEPANP